MTKYKKISLLAMSIIPCISLASTYVVRVPVNDINIGTWTEEYEYTDWKSSGESYDCLGDIEENDVYFGKTRQQTLTCKQLEERVKTEIRTSSLGEVKTSDSVETRIVDSVTQQNIVGSYLAGSCKRALDFDKSLPTGVTKIKLSGGTVLNVYCDMNFDGGGWTLVFSHNVQGGYFQSPEEAAYSNVNLPSLSTGKYSILRHLSELKSQSKFEFKQAWNGYSRYQHWKQDSNPNTSAVVGYEPISISSTSDYWGGLERSTSGASYIDGSSYHGNWFYAVGSYIPWYGGIPSSMTIVPNGIGVPNVNLWVR